MFTKHEEISWVDYSQGENQVRIVAIATVWL